MATQLTQMIERFITAGREAHARGGDSPFDYSLATNPPDTRRIVGSVLGEWRFSLVDDQTAEPRREVCALTVGGVRFIYYAFKDDRIGEAVLSPDYLSVHYTVKGDRILGVGKTIIATSTAGEYIFATNKSPPFEATMANDLVGLSVFIPIPEAQRFTLRVGSKLDGELKSLLDEGFFVLGRSPLWDTHISYALDYALAQAASGTAASAFLLDEYLYLLFCHELAAQVRARDADQPFVAVPIKLKLAEAFVIENAPDAPTVEQVAAAAGLSVRNLHALFVKFRGMSPSAFIRERRLLGIRTALRTAGPRATVSEVATAWGYNNFGNFAAAYRKRFKELPSETLDHAQQENPANPGSPGGT